MAQTFKYKKLTIKSVGVEIATLSNVEFLLETENDIESPTSPVSIPDDRDDVEMVISEEIAENQPNTPQSDSPVSPPQNTPEKETENEDTLQIINLVEDENNPPQTFLKLTLIQWQIIIWLNNRGLLICLIVKIYL